MSSHSKLVIAVLALAAFPGLVEPTLAQDGAAQKFAQDAAMSNRFEVEAAKIALDVGRDQSAKDFAQDMLDDHSRSLAELEKAAEAEKVSLPTEQDAGTKEKLQALRDASANDFDQAYLSTQVAAHEDAVHLYDTYAKGGPEGALKNYASRTVGTLRTHNVRIHGLTHQ
jgi:putative membrane protein